MRYVVLGAGKQGTAIAHDLIHFGSSDSVVIVDRDLLPSMPRRGGSEPLPKSGTWTCRTMPPSSFCFTVRRCASALFRIS